MRIKINDCHFENCGTGISAPKDAPLELSGTRFVACRKAIELRDPPSLLSELGLTENTPPAMLREVLAFISQGEPEPAVIQTQVEASGLLRWLAAGADASTLVGALVSIAKSGLIPSVLAMLSS